MMTALRIATAAALSLSATTTTDATEAPSQQFVQLWSFGIWPRPLHLAAGRPVTLTFVNRSRESHDFSALSFFAHARMEAGAVPSGRIDLAPQESRSVTLVPSAGTYEAHCSHFFHKQMGMSDFIIVD